MIIKRNASGRARAIVRRSAVTVGEKSPRSIVRRAPRGGGDGGGARVAPAPEREWAWVRGVVLLAIAMTSIGMLMAGGWWLWESPAFRVNHVTVEGNSRIGTESIVGSAGLFGKSMFTADLADAQEVLYGYPLVSSVSIERHWPNTIHIVIEERQAWGSWEQAGVKYTIDRDGVVLGTDPPPSGSPAVRDTSVQTSLRVGDRVSYQAVDAAAEIYDRLPRQLGTTVTEVAYIAGKGVQVTAANGQTALLGDSSSIAYKLAVWAALMTEARNSGIEYTTIDLRYGNRPVLQ